MIIVRMGLSLAWQNDSQNRSSLTQSLQLNRQLAALAQPQSHFVQSIRIDLSTTSVDESQSTAKIEGY